MKFSYFGDLPDNRHNLLALLQRMRWESYLPKQLPVKCFLFTLLTCSVMSVINAQDTTLLIVPCASGNLFIDGVDKGAVTAEDAHPHKLLFGDHYLQLRVAEKKYNLTLKLDRALSSNIIRLGCEEKNNAAIRLMDKKMTIVGLINPQTEKNMFTLDAGDELVVTCNVLNKNGTVNLSVTRQETGGEIYRKESVNRLDHEKISIPQRGIYIVTLTTNAFLAREAAVMLERIPGKKSNVDFSTSVGYVTDTAVVEVMNTTTRVFSITSGHTPRTAVKINLPPGTTYWTYWIGVGQQSREQFKQFATSMASGLQAVSSNPLVLFGKNLIGTLPMLNMTSTISYRFASGQESAAFVAGNPFRYYQFKFAGNISTDYSLVSNTGTDVTLCLDNKSAMVGQDVDIKVVAFIVTSKLGQGK